VRRPAPGAVQLHGRRSPQGGAEQRLCGAARSAGGEGNGLPQYDDEQ